MPVKWFPEFNLITKSLNSSSLRNVKQPLEWAMVICFRVCCLSGTNLNTVDE